MSRVLLLALVTGAFVYREQRLTTNEQRFAHPPPAARDLRRRG